METPTPRGPYPTDVTDEGWAFAAPYLSLLDPDAPQRRHDPREVFDALLWIVRAGSPWRTLPNDLPPWAAVHQQTQRWIEAGCFAATVHDLWVLLHTPEGRVPDSTAMVFGGRTLRSSPESGHHAGYDGHKLTKGDEVHAAVDGIGPLA